MAVTVGISQTVPIGMLDTKITTTPITFDASYPTGGEPVTAANLGLTTVLTAVATVKTAGAGSVTQVWYDIANSKLKAYVAAAEVTAAVDLSAVTAEIVAIGK